MRHVDTIVIGAGHAGLATSRLLTDAGRDHVVLDRGRLAESWRSARWDSLRLLTPNWMSRLPEWTYRGRDPEGFMAAAELVRYLESYAQSFDAPVQQQTSVLDVCAVDGGYRIRTTRGAWRARNVVAAAGPRPQVPKLAARLRPEIRQIHTSRYRNPASLPDGGVLVVGASASGVQIAAELRRAGRAVVLAAGTHTRLPRQYRGMDIMWWLEQIGALDRTVDDTDASQARREPSAQLTGSQGAPELNLRRLHELGVVVTGRLAGLDGSWARFRDDLPFTTAAAEARLRRMLRTIDEHVVIAGLEDEVLPAADPAPVRLTSAQQSLDLRTAGISTVVWATGFHHAYPWLRVPGAVASSGEVEQYRGITPVRGLYVVGLRFMHRRNSQFIDGARHDARTIVEHLVGADRAALKRAEEP